MKILNGHGAGLEAEVNYYRGDVVYSGKTGLRSRTASLTLDFRVIFGFVLHRGHRILHRRIGQLFGVSNGCFGASFTSACSWSDPSFLSLLGPVVQVNALFFLIKIQKLFPFQSVQFKRQFGLSSYSCQNMLTLY